MRTHLDTELEQKQSSTNPIARLDRGVRRFLACLLIAVGLILVAPLAGTASAATEGTPAETHAYTVTSGDTLTTIARRCHTSVERIVADNRGRIENPHLIYPGQRFELTRRTVWIVRPGETLTQVSQCTGESVEALVERNSIRNRHLIDVGQRLELEPVAQRPPSGPPPGSPAGPPSETPTEPAPPQAGPDPVVVPPAGGESTAPWLSGAVALAAFAFLLFAAAPLGRALVGRMHRDRSNGSAVSSSAPFVALASHTNSAGSRKVAIDAGLFGRIVAAASAVEGIRSVGRVRLWRDGDAVRCTVPVEVEATREPSEVARRCAAAVAAEAPELGEVVVGLEGAPVEGSGEPDSEPATEQAVAAAARTAAGPRPVLIGGIGSCVYEFGPEDGPPVICVHGFAASARMFRPLARHLASAGFRVYVPDLPGGLGVAAPPERGPVTPQLVSFLAAAVEELSPARRPILVAHSQGAYVAARLASQRPELVRSLVCLGPAGLDEARWMRLMGRAWFGALLRTLLRSIGRRGRTRVAALLYRFAMGGKGAGAMQFAARLADRGTALRLASAGPQFLHEVFADGLDPGAVGIPALYLWGDADNTTPASGALRVLAEAPKATVRIFAGLGHVPMLEEPERIAEAIAGWRGAKPPRSRRRRRRNRRR